MSDRDEIASISASQKSSHALSAKEETTQDASTPDQLESLYAELPSNATELKALVGTMRLELSKKDQSITKLKEDLDEVKASHSVILQRSAEWQDELETLRSRVPQLEEELQTEKKAREDESDRVKDLRLRAEESRRAIMRLQGEQSDARAKAKVDHRRSWNPAATIQPPVVRDEQEEAELKKSKRASLAFGPNALNALNLTLANRPGSSQGFGHRRTASGSRSVSGASKGEGEEFEEPLSPTFANGLRGLRLSGTAGTNGNFNSLLVPGADDNGNSAPSSRRSSFLSDGARSPRLAPGDSSLPDTSDAPSLSATRLSVPASGPGPQRGIPLSSPALSQGAASSVGIGSPILEDNEEEEEGTPSLGVNSVKALPNLPSRESSINFQAHDRELRAKEVEIERLTREMGEMRMSMAEAVEARKASEACLKALRDFIAHHDDEADANGQMGDDADRIVQRASFGAGLLKGVKLPPLPTDEIDDAEEAAHVSPHRTASAGGWGLKMPSLMRKGTSSSGPTPTDEAEADGTPSANATWSPRRSSIGPAPPAKSIGSSFAGIGNLLSRTTPVDTPPASVPAGPATTTSPSSETISPPTADEGALGSGFRIPGWFKRSSVVQPSQPPTQAEPLEEKVSFPPFRSLDHDQLSISRQPSETVSTIPSLSSGPSISTSASSIRASGGDALATAARLGDEMDVKKVAERVESEDMAMSDRARRAAEKTGQVEHLTDVVPAFD